MRLRNIMCSFVLVANVVLLTACSTDPVTFVAGASPPPPPTKPAPVTSDTVVTRRGFVWSSETGLEVIPVPKGATSMDVTAMNNGGQVVGYVTLGALSENYRAFTWLPSGGYTALGSLVGPDGISMALSITDAGDVTGLSEGPHIGYEWGIQLGDAFIWNAQSGIKAIPMGYDYASGTPGVALSPEFRPIDAGGKLMLPAGANCVQVVRTNARGQAIGYAGTYQSTQRLGNTNDDCHYTNALLWAADGGFVTIDECGPRSGCRTTLVALNNRGELLGNSNADGGFKWTASGGMVRIPMAAASVNVINDNGDAAGCVGTVTLCTPFVWLASGEIKVLQMPVGARKGFPVSLNNKGVMAGSFE